jgi:hypothetical protein
MSDEVVESPGSRGSIFTNRAMLAAWIGLAAFALWSTRETWADLINIAERDEEQSHIMLVPVISVWLAWMRRLRLRHLRPTGTAFGIPIILLGWWMSHFGYFNSVQAAWHAGAVIVLVGVVVVGCGVNTLLKLFPAFAVLAFIVPIPGMIRHAVAGPLQTASAAVTQALLETVGVPVERSSNLLVINDHDVAVAEACNGMRMVLALILVSFAFAFSMPLRQYTRAIVLVASPVVALACNIVRLLPTVMLYGYASQPVADHFHDISGWLMLPIAFLVLRGIVSLLAWAQVPVSKFTLAYQ